MNAPDCTATDFTFTYRLEGAPDRYNPRVVVAIFTSVGVNLSVDLGSIWGTVQLRSYCCGGEYGHPMDEYLFCSTCGNNTTALNDESEGVSDVFAPGVSKTYQAWFDHAGLIASPLLAEQLRELLCNFYSEYEAIDEERRAYSTEEEMMAYVLQRLDGRPLHTPPMSANPRLLAHDYLGESILRIFWPSFTLAVEIYDDGPMLVPLSFCCSADLKQTAMSGSICSKCNGLLKAAPFVLSLTPSATDLLPYAAFENEGLEVEAEALEAMFRELEPLLPNFSFDAEVRAELEPVLEKYSNPFPTSMKRRS